ncbi:RagB/SusD family nutrient uptake outer membrane protein [Echinicola shivajiensis]|uniref:RagB/SusD family nutrient uptake outer membrane protein n=1 Tax=Echinicola shivajiensis TaxID=1035916 RepID=UPI001BFC8074|nr:RagB/SusD family nutrient uptake outer membrane protein [Echinicola shivajiensis]
MKNNFTYISMIIICTGLLFQSCQEFLDDKPSKDIVVPKTTQDIEALLTNYRRFCVDPLITFVLGPDYETTTELWEGLDPWQQNAYLWKADIFGPLESSVDYGYLYTQVFHANLSLDLMEEGIDGKAEDIRELQGLAHFLRAYAHTNLALLHLPLLGSQLDDGSHEIPFKLVSDISEKAHWAGTDEVYGQIITDLEAAIAQLPTSVSDPIHVNTVAARALLARVYLLMGNFEGAAAQADLAIANGPELLDYQELDPEMDYPFELFNRETLYYSKTDGKLDITSSPSTLIPMELYGSYTEGDTRKDLFFSATDGGRQNFRGSYTGGYTLFTGISLPEAYLIAAESHIRTGNMERGLSVLGQFMETRYRENMAPTVDGLNEGEALGLVLAERKRELVFRGRSWEDFKRSHRDFGQEAETIRTIGGESYALSSNEDRTIIAIPEIELKLEERP